MKIETLYSLGDTVYQKLGEQPQGLVTRIDISPASGTAYSVLYWVSLETGDSKPYYEFELTTEKTYSYNEKA